MCSATSSAARAAAAARRCSAARTCAIELELELPQAVFGHQVEIEVARLAECEVCHGTGSAKGSSPATCDTCGGAGQVRISQGFFQLQQTCPRCRGAGTIVRNPCDTCLGQGRVRRSPQARGEGPGGCRYRATVCASPAKARPAATAARRGSVRRDPRARARDFRARRRAPQLRSAGQLRHRGARRQSSTSRRSRAMCS